MNNASNYKTIDEDTSINTDAARRCPVSAFVVSFNEEDKLRACLESLSFCDEILVVDSFSTDRTIEIARSAGAKVIQNPWKGNKEQKSFALNATSHEWVINLDADERVTPELRDNILKVLARAKYAESQNREPEANGYEFSRVVFYMGRWWRKGGWYPEYRVRLLRKSKTVWGGTNPHERPIISGKVKRLKGELSHFSYDDLRDHLTKLIGHASVSAKAEIARGKVPTITNLTLSPLIRSLKFYFLKFGYREGAAGLIVAVLEGFYTFIKYAMMWESVLKSRSNEDDSK